MHGDEHDRRVLDPLGSGTNYPGASPEEEQPQRWRLGLYGAIAGSLRLMALVLWIGLGGVGMRPEGTTTSEGADDNGLAAAQQVLSRQTDLNSCRSALQQISSYLLQNPKLRPDPLTSEDRQYYETVFGLDQQALAEIEGPGYTLLDAHYLEQCFLLRDVVSALEPAARGRRAERAAQQDDLRRAFDWVIRQVRLLPDDETLAVPPVFTLRRGEGRALERALVFLSLIRQLPNGEHLTGCLIYCPDESGENRLWACGVLLREGDDVYLFDPRVGLALPGPGGEGIATLAQAAKDPEVLGQLTVDPSKPYDVTAAQAARAQLQLEVPLSALAPRNTLLERTLLGRALRVKLGGEVRGQMERLMQAAQALELAPVVGWKERVEPGGATLSGPEVMRRFLPPEEGGSDTSGPIARRQLIQLRLVPWSYLPDQFRDEQRFPRNVGLGQRLSGYYAHPFLSYRFDNEQPRDLTLRGHYTKAAPQLIRERDRVLEEAQRFQVATELGPRVDRWVADAIPIYADLERARAAQDEDAELEARARIEEHWKRAEPVVILLQGSQAHPRLMLLTYLLAQCKQEVAEQEQARLAESFGAGDQAAEKEDVRQAWEDAQGWWQKLLAEFPDSPARGHALRLQARALALLDRKEEAAAALRVGAATSPLEEVARAYLAKRYLEARVSSRPGPDPSPADPDLVWQACSFRDEEAPAPKLPAPRRVTLKADGMSLARVLEAVASQTGIRVEDRRGEGDQAITLTLEETPFWEALDRIATASGAMVYLYPRTGRIFLVKAPAGVKQVWTSYAGPFRVALKRVAVARDLEQGAQTSTASLEVGWEPWVMPYFLETRPQQLRVTDGGGNPVEAAASGSSLAPVDGRVALAFDFPLPTVDRAVASLARVEGDLPVVVPTRMLELDFGPLAQLEKLPADAPGRVKRQDGAECWISKITRASDRWTIQVTLSTPPGNVSLESYQLWVVNNEMRLVKDGAGGAWKSSSYILDSNTPQRAVISYHFLTKDAPGAADPAAWKLHYTTPAGLVQNSIHFLFKDVPLP